MRRCFKITLLSLYVLNCQAWGNPWEIVRHPPTTEYFMLQDLFCLDWEHVWALGQRGVLIHTIDSGQTWQRYQTPATFYSIYFVNQNTGWASGSGIFRTDDAGKTWQQQTDVRALRFYFVNTTIGWAVGRDGIILHTSDGHQWEPQKSGTNEILDRVFFVNEKEGWVVGWGGSLLHTSNGGQSWEIQRKFPPDLIAYDVFFTNPAVGWLVGKQGLILQTTDGGNTWQRQESGTVEQLSRVYFVNPNEGWIAGWKTLLHTTDGGQSWHTLKDEWLNLSIYMWFLDANRGWIANQWIYRTEDGGRTGQLSFMDDHPSVLQAVSFIKAQEGWVAGSGGVLIHTTDGGKTWQNQSNLSLLTFSPQKIFFVDAQTGWMMGWFQKVPQSLVRTHDGGNTWTIHPLPIESFGNDFYFLDRNRGCLVTLFETLYTDDGGRRGPKSTCRWEVQRVSILWVKWDGQSTRMVAFISSEVSTVASIGKLPMRMFPLSTVPIL